MTKSSNKTLKDLEIKAKPFIRVGDDYYKITHRPDKNGKLHRVLAKRSKTTITDDNTTKVLAFIPKYEDFVIVPSHIGYQQVIHGHYNKYYELSHIPKKGKFETIKSFLLHLFGESYLDFILDYFQLLYTRPTQNLPIILLESEQKNTGKSTFGFFVEKIFQFNSISLGNSDLNNQFNSIWIDKLMIVIDEASLEEKPVMEMIKRLSTEKGAVLSQAKSKDKVSVDFIGKFIFISNNEGKALPIERGEKRFAVFKVSTFSSKGIKDNPNILDKLQAEIPAFLHYLKDRTLTHENKSRMYFDTDVYFTDQLKLYFEGNNGYVTKAVQALVKDTFEMFPEETSLSFSITNLLVELQKGSYVKFTDRQKVRESLEKDLSLCLQKKGRFTYFSLSQAETSNGATFCSSENNAFYTFKREDYKSDSSNNAKTPVQKLEQLPVFEHFGTDLEHILEQSSN